VRTPLVLSIVFHIVVLSAVIFNFTSSRSLDTGPKPVTVELVPSAAVTQVTAGKKDAPQQEAASAAPAEEKKPEPAPKAPDPKPVDKVAEKQAAPPPPLPKSEPPKPVEAKPEPEKKAEAKPEPAEQLKREEAAKPERDSPKPEKPKVAEVKPKKPEPKPEPKEEAKPERDKTPFRDRIADVLKHPAEQERKAQPAPPVQTKREFDPDRISALLNRDPKAGSPAAQEGPKEPWRKPSSLQDQAMGVENPALPRRETLGAPGGQDTQLTRNDIDALNGQIGRCWNIPVGGLGAESIVVKIHILLNKDGSLAGQPEIRNQGSSPFFQAAADAAVRAVLQCQPYSLPPEKFDQWNELTLNFDPKRMYGG
jgi:outer membrane biosynthesis protein TonB